MSSYSFMCRVIFWYDSFSSFTFRSLYSLLSLSSCCWRLALTRPEVCAVEEGWLVLVGAFSAASRSGRWVDAMTQSASALWSSTAWACLLNMRVGVRRYSCSCSPFRSFSILSRACTVSQNSWKDCCSCFWRINDRTHWRLRSAPCACSFMLTSCFVFSSSKKSASYFSISVEMTYLSSLLIDASSITSLSFRSCTNWSC